VPDADPDRALRRQVARLARARPEDIEAVLAELDPGRRRAVEALLAPQAGRPARAPAAAVARPDPPLAIAGLAPALSERLAQAGRGEGPMTRAAADALRASAKEMLDLGLALSPPAEAPLPATVLSRLRAGLSRRSDAR